ncbi:hypothetical protein [Aeromicrobium sp. UC242_57]|uniref:hypothetical protein n=1 Tax=Aeromicrobium sp. UC242_57 TaxID=3374624 RepID=UPI0037AC4A92
MSDQDSAAHNPPHEDDHLDRRIAQKPEVTPQHWVRRIVLAIVIVGVAYIAYLMSAAFFPRWWAQRVADQVNGGVTRGTMWGLFYGFVFTAIPLLLLFQVRRKFFSWTWRGVVALVAIVLAAPNWLTLSVVAGNSNAAHAGERIFDVDAPGFRAATLIGVITGAVVVVIFTGLSMRLRRRKAEVERLRGERDELRRSRDDTDESV